MSTPERQRQIYSRGAQGQRPALPIAFDGLEGWAEMRLSNEAFAYLAGGAGAEGTMAANRQALDGVRIVPRMLRDVSKCDMTAKLFGNSLSVPFFLCPVGALDLAHPHADLAVARAAARTNVPMCFSNQASFPMETCAAAMGDGVRWFQLYWSANDDLVVSLVRRAENCGCRAIVVTLDTTMLGWRTRDLELAHLPFLRGRGIAQYTSDPVFLKLLEKTPADTGDKPKVTRRAIATLFEATRRFPGPFWEVLKSGKGLAAVKTFVSLYSRSNLQWSDLAFLREHTKLPIVLKGILHPDDALKALDHGVNAVYVSNHGGRQVDGAVGAAAALPKVVDAVDGRVPVLFDSGVRGGADIFKGLALGATAVGIGRPFAYALALGGEDGVAEYLENLKADFRLTMGLSGCASLAEIDRATLSL
jgi:lactate 2-monooxygenase